MSGKGSLSFFSDRSEAAALKISVEIVNGTSKVRRQKKQVCGVLFRIFERQPGLPDQVNAQGRVKLEPDADGHNGSEPRGVVFVAAHPLDRLRARQGTLRQRLYGKSLPGHMLNQRPGKRAGKSAEDIGNFLHGGRRQIEFLHHISSPLF